MRIAIPVICVLVIAALAPIANGVHITDFTDFKIYPPNETPSGALPYDTTKYILTSIDVKDTSNERLDLGIEIIITDNKLEDKKNVICFAKYDKLGTGTPQYSFEGLPCDYVYGVQAWGAKKAGIWYGLIPKRFFEDYRREISECRAYVRFTLWKEGCVNINPDWYNTPGPNVSVEGYSPVTMTSVSTKTVGKYLNLLTGTSDWNLACNKDSDVIHTAGGVKVYNLKSWEWAIDKYFNPIAEDRIITVNVPSGTPIDNSRLTLSCGKVSVSGTLIEVVNQTVKFNISSSSLQTLLTAGCTY